MSTTMRKAVAEIITKLKKLPEPGKKTGSFWDFMRNQLMDEGEWDQKHIKVIEKEIEAYLTKLDKKSLIEMWKATPEGEEKYDDDVKIDVKEMKTDIVDEMVGQVMDRMDDNYSSRDSFMPTQSESFAGNGKKHSPGENPDEETEPEDISDEDVPLDDDLFNENIDDEDEDFKF